MTWGHLPGSHPHVPARGRALINAPAVPPGDLHQGVPAGLASSFCPGAGLFMAAWKMLTGTAADTDTLSLKLEVVRVEFIFLFWTLDAFVQMWMREI